MEPHRCGIFLLGLKYFDCFVFSSNCGECFTCSFNPVVNVLLELLIQYVVCFGFSWEVLFCLWQPPSCRNLFAFWIAPFQVFLCFEGEWVGRITNCFFFFFFTLFLFLKMNIHVPIFCLFCLLYSTSVLKYDCTAGTVTEQLFYPCSLLRSCVSLKTEPLLNTNKIQPLVFIQMRHRALFILGNVNCPSLLPVLNLQLSNLCELLHSWWDIFVIWLWTCSTRMSLFFSSPVMLYAIKHVCVSHSSPAHCPSFLLELLSAW